jgi:hypothetical protein
MGRPKGSKNAPVIPTGYKDDKFEVKQEKQTDKYIVIKSQTFEFFQLIVNNAIQDGYVCQGGVSVTCYRDVNGIEFCYAQAMVLKSML